MRSDTPGVVARINAELKAAGRVERLVRGRGYLYLRDGAAVGFHTQGIYGASSYEAVRSSIVALFADNDLPDPFRKGA